MSYTPNATRHMNQNQKQTLGRSMSEIQTKTDEVVEVVKAEKMTQEQLLLAAGMDIGRIQVADFFLKIGTSVLVSSFENIKKSKVWESVTNKNSSDGRKYQSLDEFCQVNLGKSYKRLQEMSGNMRVMGEEAFEQAEKIGLRQSDYNIIKSLPAPKQDAIKEALSEGASKEDLQRVLRDFIVSSQQELDLLTEDVAQRDKKISNLNVVCDKVEAELRVEKRKHSHRSANQRPIEAEVLHLSAAEAVRQIQLAMGTLIELMHSDKLHKLHERWRPAAVHALLASVYAVAKDAERLAESARDAGLDVSDDPTAIVQAYWQPAEAAKLDELLTSLKLTHDAVHHNIQVDAEANPNIPARKGRKTQRQDVAA